MNANHIPSSVPSAVTHFGGRQRKNRAVCPKAPAFRSLIPRGYVSTRRSPRLAGIGRTAKAASGLLTIHVALKHLLPFGSRLHQYYSIELVLLLRGECFCLIDTGELLLLAFGTRNGLIVSCNSRQCIQINLVSHAFIPH